MNCEVIYSTDQRHLFIFTYIFPSLVQSVGAQSDTKQRFGELYVSFIYAGSCKGDYEC